jgi:alcohol dehydrogenase class IV
VMAFNAATRMPELAELATALGVGECDGAEEDSAGRQASGARAAVTAVADLLASVGIPADLAALGAPADRLPWAAAEAMTARRLVDNNPRPLDEAAALALLRAAYAGDRTAAAVIPGTADTGMSTS